MTVTVQVGTPAPGFWQWSDFQRKSKPQYVHGLMELGETEEASCLATW